MWKATAIAVAAFAATTTDAANVSIELCKEFQAALRAEDPTCLETLGSNWQVHCTAECFAIANRIRVDTSSYTDCYNANPCSGSEGAGCYALCSSSAASNPAAVVPKNLELVDKEPQRPFSNVVALKCSAKTGETELHLPCIAPGMKKYYEVWINDVHGFEYTIYSKSGGPVGVVDMYGITDVGNDEVFDCFPADTRNTAACDTALIQRGITISLPFTFKNTDAPVGLPIRFGIKGCAGHTGCDNVLVFKTAALKKAANAHGCITKLQEVWPQATDYCTVGAAGAFAPSAAVMLAAVLAVVSLVL